MRRAIATTLALALPACLPPGPGRGLAPVPACPQLATPDASGRCTCAAGRVVVLGACVEPAVADAYCGPAAVPGPAGACRFRECSAREALESGGRCRALSDVVLTGPRCAAPSALVIQEGGRTACVPPDAACPRGTFAVHDACSGPPACPAGSLPTAGACRPVVEAQAPGRPVVDLGTWSLYVLGATGGPGSAELCRPLQSRPAAFGLQPGEVAVVTLELSLRVPDQDLSRVYAGVRLTAPAPRSLPPDAAELARGAVSTLLEPLRALGGQASTSALSAEVHCTIASF